MSERRHLTADDPGEVGLLWGEDVEFGLVGSLALILSNDLQSESVIIADVDLLTVTATRKIKKIKTTTINRGK